MTETANTTGATSAPSTEASSNPGPPPPEPQARSGVPTPAERRAQTLAAHGLSGNNTNTAVAGAFAPDHPSDSVQLTSEEKPSVDFSGMATEETPDVMIDGSNNVPEDGQSKEQERALRRQHLLIQKQDRQAREQLKRVQAEQASLQGERERMAKIEAARGQWQQDPTAILREAGLDPNLYAQKLLRHYVELDKPVDPVQQKIDQTVAPYIEALQKRDAEAYQHQVAVAAANATNQLVRPILADNADNYEVLLSIHNGDVNAAASDVFMTAQQIWSETGQRPDFKAIADAKEAALMEQVDLAIKRTSSLKKYRERFRQGDDSAVDTSSSRTDKKTAVQGNQGKTQSATRSSQATLTNNNNVSVARVSKPIDTSRTTSVHESRIAETLAKHGLDSQGRKRVSVK